MSADFEWWGKDRESVAVPEQGAIAVYCNDQGSVIVRQQQYPDDDVFIVVQPQNAMALVRAILEAAGITQDTTLLLTDERSSGDSTAAERMRRHRQRKSKRNGADDVTAPVTAPVTANQRNAPEPVMLFPTAAE